MREDVEVANREEYEVGEGLQRTESGSAVLDDLDDTVKTFGYGIGKGTFDERKNVVLMELQRGREGPH